MTRPTFGKRGAPPLSAAAGEREPAAPAHFVLRWLKYAGLGAYAVGGLCAAFVRLAFAATQGARVDVAETVILLSDGAVAGLLYRLLSGAVPSAGRRETRRSDAIAPPPDRSAD